MIPRRPPGCGALLLDADVVAGAAARFGLDAFAVAPLHRGPKTPLQLELVLLEANPLVAQVIRRSVGTEGTQVWIDTDGWMDGWMDGWRDEWMDGCMHACMDGWRDGGMIG